MSAEFSITPLILAVACKLPARTTLVIFVLQGIVWCKRITYTTFTRTYIRMYTNIYERPSAGEGNPS